MPFFLLLLAVLIVAAPARAETAGDTREALSNTLSALRESGERKQQLEKKTAALERELHRLQEHMVSLAQSTQNQEDALSSAEEKLDILETQRKGKTQALEKQKAELSAVISAIIKLRRFPPEAVIAMPGKLDEVLATARVLGVVTRAIGKEAESLKAQLRELEVLEDKIRRNRSTLAAKKVTLTEEYARIVAEIRKRSQLQVALGLQEREERERMVQLTAKSRNLQELLDSLEQQGSNVWERRAAAGARKASRDSHSRGRSFAAAQGALRQPSGKIVNRYGNSRMGTAFSKGIVFAMREKAGIVAPFDGEVVFAGTFRDYGHMIIIRHSHNYHSLLAGMEHVHCAPGQFLLEGEPIGAMGGHTGSNRLYLELRKDGKPVDPQPWFKKG